MYDGEVYFGECDGFCSSFCIASGGISMLIECSAHKFEGNSIEEFFLVVVNNGQNTMCRLVNVF